MFILVQNIEANLFRQVQNHQPQKSIIPSSSRQRNLSANRQQNNNNGSQTERAVPSYLNSNRAPLLGQQSSREKPMLVLQVNLGDSFGLVNMGVFKNDTASTVAQRIIRESNVKFNNTAE